MSSEELKSGQEELKIQLECNAEMQKLVIKTNKDVEKSYKILTSVCLILCGLFIVLIGLTYYCLAR